MAPAVGALLGFMLGTAPVPSLGAVTIEQWGTLIGDGIQLLDANAKVTKAVGVRPVIFLPLSPSRNAGAATRLQPGMGPH